MVCNNHFYLWHPNVVIIDPCILLFIYSTHICDVKMNVSVECHIFFSSHLIKELQNDKEVTLPDGRLVSSYLCFAVEMPHWPMIKNYHSNYLVNTRGNLLSYGFSCLIYCVINDPKMSCNWQKNHCGIPLSWNKKCFSH